MADETVLAKGAFEWYAALHGVTVLHCHANNGRLADNKFQQSIDKTHGQTLTFCSVNAHFQNGVTTRKGFVSFRIVHAQC